MKVSETKNIEMDKVKVFNFKESEKERITEETQLKRWGKVEIKKYRESTEIRKVKVGKVTVIRKTQLEGQCQW